MKTIKWHDLRKDLGTSFEKQLIMNLSKKEPKKIYG